MPFEFDVFICYSRKDAKFVDRLTASLQQAHVRVWRDTLRLKVGDQHVAKIVEAVQRSRFFALVISPAAMESYFIRKIEIQAGINQMIAQKRESFVLPILWKRPKASLDPLIASFNYLDFTKSRNYMENTKHLISRVLLEDEQFTGTKLYKGMDVTLDGVMVGVGEELKSLPSQSASVKMFYEDGAVRYVELYDRDQLTKVKTVSYDSAGRVSEIALIEGGRLIDTWRYEYSPVTGRRSGKLTVRPGERPHMRIPYDVDGDKGPAQAL